MGLGNCSRRFQVELVSKWFSEVLCEPLPLRVFAVDAFALLESSMPKHRNLRQLRPPPRVEHVLDDQAEFRVALDRQFVVEGRRFLIVWQMPTIY